MRRSTLRSVVIGALFSVLLPTYAAMTPPAMANQKQVGGTPGRTVTFELLAVDGNQIVVRLPEGTRELTVAGDFRFNVDGKPLSVRELKPGMNGTVTIATTTTTTPVTVTEVKNGTVAHADGSTLIVRTDEGFKLFSQGDVDKRGVKIMREGKFASVSDFRAGDRVSAVIITSRPPNVVTQQEVSATLAASGSGAAAGATAGSVAAATGTAGGAAAAGPRTLPKTASPVPLLGLLGGLSLAAGLALTIRRRRVRYRKSR